MYLFDQSRTIELWVKRILLSEPGSLSTYAAAWWTTVRVNAGRMLIPLLRVGSRVNPSDRRNGDRFMISGTR